MWVVVLLYSRIIDNEAKAFLSEEQFWRFFCELVVIKCEVKWRWGEMTLGWNDLGLNDIGVKWYQTVKTPEQ